MVRTQIYLTHEEKAALGVLSTKTGKKQSALIRQAVDSLIAEFSRTRRETALDRAAGMWKGRKDLPDFAAVRRGLDRGMAR
jgi:hypothetical protein